MPLRLADFDYPLPPELIAHTAAEPRDSAKLLVWPQNRLHTVADLPKLLQPGDLLVINTSKVIPARLFGIRKARGNGPAGGADVKIEILLHQPQGPGLTRWTAFGRPTRRLKPGDVIHLDGGAEAEITALNAETGQTSLAFNLAPEHVQPYLEAHGHTPLPPYIKAADSSAVRARYQTVYADPQQPGSVAAPTAGLHFTPDLLSHLQNNGINIAHVTLHVGAGTFQNPTETQIRTQTLHAEWAHLPPATAQAIAATRGRGNRVVAVGTTATRTLESWALQGMNPQGFSGNTTLFIQPGFKFQVVDRLLTNFHLPQSSLLMLIAAFIGPSWQDLYRTAVQNRLRFYSFGDTSLLTRHDAEI
jgi:S-adenosylmethionine:tRNA ribosyltransferase-isomerase